VKRELKERDIVKYFNKKVLQYGGEIRKVIWSGRSHAPDKRVMLSPSPFWTELKKPGKYPTDAQEREHARMRAQGENVVWFNSIEQIDNYFIAHFGYPKYYVR
jgi:hypothetical protein